MPSLLSTEYILIWNNWFSIRELHSVTLYMLGSHMGDFSSLTWSTLTKIKSTVGFLSFFLFLSTHGLKSTIYGSKFVVSLINLYFVNSSLPRSDGVALRFVTFSYNRCSEAKSKLINLLCSCFFSSHDCETVPMIILYN